MAQERFEYDHKQIESPMSKTTAPIFRCSTYPILPSSLPQLPQLPPAAPIDHSIKIRRCNKCDCGTAIASKRPATKLKPPIIRITRSESAPILAKECIALPMSSMRSTGDDQGDDEGNFSTETSESSTKRKIYTVYINGTRQEFRLCELNTMTWFRENLINHPNESYKIRIEFSDHDNKEEKSECYINTFGMEELAVIIDCKQL